MAKKKKVKKAPTKPRSIFAEPEISKRMIVSKGPTKKDTLTKEAKKYPQKFFDY